MVSNWVSRIDLSGMPLEVQGSLALCEVPFAVTADGGGSRKEG
jgi:hypothetical protein